LSPEIATPASQFVTYPFVSSPPSAPKYSTSATDAPHCAAGAIRGYDLIRSNKYYPFDTSRCENDLQITPWDPEAFKLSADELMAEHGVKVYFYTQFTEILKEGNKVVGGVIENRSGRQVILPSASSTAPALPPSRKWPAPNAAASGARAP